MSEEKNPLKKNETADQSVRVIDEEFLQAKDLTTLFIKTIKSFRLYPGDNPTLIGIQEQLFRRFQNHLEMYNSLILEIGEYDFSFEGRQVYEDRELKGSLPFFFFKDGLREIRFMEGVEEWEVKGFIDIIVQRDNINEFEDDLVTLLWEKDFIHIGYTAVNPFFEEASVSIPETPEQFRVSARSEPMPASARDDFEGEKGEGEFVFNPDVYVEMSGTASAAKGVSVYQLTAEELEALRKQTEEELRPDFIFNVVDILLEIFPLEKDPQTCSDLIRVLQKILESLLVVGEFQKAGDLLKRLYALPSTHSLQEEQLRLIEELVSVLGDSNHARQIGKILEKGTDLRLEEVSAYLLLLRPDSVPGWIEVLGELTNSKGRRMLCEVISELGKNRIDLIAQSMGDPRWYLIRNLVYILGKIGQESAVPHLQKAYGHNEPRVRREAMQAAGLIGSPRAIALLTQALRDPDLRIRSMAAINLARAAKRAGLSALLEVVQGKDFAKRDPAEVKSFLDAVGSIKSNDALRPLQQILEHKGWFGGRIKNEVRVGAAGAIALIGTPEAKAALQSGADSRDENIRQACREAKRRYGV